MKLYGLQKMTLLDYPGKVACTLFTGGCNLRCPFCHNSSLVTALCEEDTHTEEEIIEFLKKRTGLLDGVCITGGEPLLQPDIEELIKKIKELGYFVKLDTNGCFPDKLKGLLKEKLLDYVAMDIKNSKARYAETVGIEDFDITPIEKSVEILMSGSIDFEFRTTVVKELHTPENIESIAKWIEGAPRYYIQCFVDSGSTLKKGLNAPEKDVIYQMKNLAEVYVANTYIRGI